MPTQSISQAFSIPEITDALREYAAWRYRNDDGSTARSIDITVYFENGVASFSAWNVFKSRPTGKKKFTKSKILKLIRAFVRKNYPENKGCLMTASYGPKLRMIYTWVIQERETANV